MYKTFLTLVILTAAPMVSAASSDITSQYTELWAKDCKTISEAEESIEKICPAILGYQLILAEGDLRQSVTIVDPKGKRHPLKYYQTISGAFTFLGPKAEWRLKKVHGSLQPQALIVRVNARESVDQPDKVTSYLAVAKITPQEICVVGKISPQKQQNELARKLADTSSQKKCLNP